MIETEECFCRIMRVIYMYDGRTQRLNNDGGFFSLVQPRIIQNHDPLLGIRNQEMVFRQIMHPYKYLK